PAANQQLPMAESESFGKCILAQLPEKDSRPLVTYRQAGDKYILLEYGENILDLRLRLRVHALMEALKQSPINGVIELSPGVRSLQINYDSRTIHQRDLVAALLAIELTLPDAAELSVQSRVRSEEHTSELQSRENLVCRLLL